MKLFTKTHAVALVFANLLLVANVQATVIDFSTFATGPVTTVGDVTFSLAGVGEAGSPYVDAGGGGTYLWNSTDGPFYPTNTILRADFDAPVKAVLFDFNPFGIHGDGGQEWRAYDAGLSLVASGAFIDGNNTYDLSTYGYISRIEWDNGRNDWLQGLERISYTVPEPATLGILGLGLLGLGAMGRKRAA